MAEFFIILIAALIMVVGLADIIREVKLYIYAPKEKGRAFRLIFLEDSSAEHQLKYALYEESWYGRRHKNRLIAVNSLLSSEIDEKCRKIAEKHGALYCSAEELDSVLEFKNKG